MPKPKPLIATSIKFDQRQMKWLKERAKSQGHYVVSQVVKRWIDAQMNMERTV